MWRFNDRLIYRTMTLEQFIRRKWGIDTDSTQTTPQPETDSDHQHRKVEWAGAEWPLYEGLDFKIELGKDYGDPRIKKMIEAGRWPYNGPEKTRANDPVRPREDLKDFVISESEEDAKE